MTERLTPERETTIKEHFMPLMATSGSERWVRELFAELDAVRAERDRTQAEIDRMLDVRKSHVRTWIEGLTDWQQGQIHAALVRGATIQVALLATTGNGKA